MGLFCLFVVQLSGFRSYLVHFMPTRTKIYVHSQIQLRDFWVLIQTQDFPKLDMLLRLLHVWIITSFFLIMITNLRRRLKDAFYVYYLFSDERGLNWLKLRTVEIECSLAISNKQLQG
jgi:hypothetical protein